MLAAARSCHGTWASLFSPRESGAKVEMGMRVLGFQKAINRGGTSGGAPAPSWWRLAGGRPRTTFHKSQQNQVPKHFGGLEMRSLRGGVRFQETTSRGCISAIQMWGVIGLDGGGCFLVCHKAAGAIVRSVVTGESKHW